MSLNNGISETSIVACCRGQAFWRLNGAQLMLQSVLIRYPIVDIMQQLGTKRVIGMILKLASFESPK
jgi:hypothetical protein